MIKDLEFNLRPNWGTSCKEFKVFMGRYPKSRKEFQKWRDLELKAINSQIDWGMVCECVANQIHMEGYKE